MDIWMEESHTDGYRVNWKISDILWREKTPFQELMIVDMFDFGKALILDGAVQTTEKDEFIYHEMISHVALNVHPNPTDVLIIGGGDGGTLREVLKHSDVGQVDMVEIDQRVVETCKQYLPSIASGFGDPRAQLSFEDRSQFVKKVQRKYDVVIVDSSDPTGPAVELYGPEFYRDCFAVLKDDGIMVAHAESPTFFTDYFKAVWRNMGVFPLRNIYLTTVPTYVSGYWAFAIGSKKYDPVRGRGDKRTVDGLKYYTEDVHGASFVLPPFIQEIIDQV